MALPQVSILPSKRTYTPGGAAIKSVNQRVTKHRGTFRL